MAGQNLSNEEPPWFKRFTSQMEPLMQESADRLSATRAASSAKEEDVRALFEALGIVVIPDPQDPTWDSVLESPFKPEPSW